MASAWSFRNWKWTVEWAAKKKAIFKIQAQIPISLKASPQAAPEQTLAWKKSFHTWKERKNFYIINYHDRVSLFSLWRFISLLIISNTENPSLSTRDTLFPLTHVIFLYCAVAFELWFVCESIFTFSLDSLVVLKNNGVHLRLWGGWESEGRIDKYREGKKLKAENKGDDKGEESSQNGFSAPAMNKAKDNLNLAIFHCVCTRIILLSFPSLPHLLTPSPTPCPSV